MGGDTQNDVLRASKLLTAMAAMLLLVTGWLFTLLVQAQQGNTESLIVLKERVTKLEVTIKNIDDDVAEHREQHWQFEIDRSK